MASVDFRGLRSNQDGRARGGGCDGLAAADFRGRGDCTQYDPKVILGAKTLDPKGDAFYGS